RQRDERHHGSRIPRGGFVLSTGRRWPRGGHGAERRDGLRLAARRPRPDGRIPERQGRSDRQLQPVGLRQDAGLRKRRIGPPFILARTRVLALLLALVGSAVSATAAATGALENVQWKLEKYSADGTLKQVPTSASIYAAFKGGTLSGKAVNAYSGPYK